MAVGAKGVHLRLEDQSGCLCITVFNEGSNTIPLCMKKGKPSMIGEHKFGSKNGMEGGGSPA